MELSFQMHYFDLYNTYNQKKNSMGRVKEGAFGGFSGKVGKVVGASWRDIDYIRSLPARVNDPKTKKQLKQRSRLSVAMNFLGTITPFLRIGFQSQATGRMTAFNAAMSYNMKFAVKEGDQGVGLDYPNVLVSQGLLSNASNVHAEVGESELRVHWEANAEGKSHADDMAMLVAHNPARGVSVYDLNAGKRANKKAGLPLPPGWKGNDIETYLAFKAADGTVVSDSLYIGRYMV